MTYCCCSSPSCQQWGCQQQRAAVPQPASYPPSYYAQIYAEPPELVLARAIEKLAAAIERMARPEPAGPAE